MNFSYSQVLEFKRILDEKFGVYLHFHDACGGQYFSFDEAEKDEVYQFLTSYFANIGGKINIADNKLTFTVDKAKIFLKDFQNILLFVIILSRLP